MAISKLKQLFIGTRMKINNWMQSKIILNLFVIIYFISISSNASSQDTDLSNQRPKNDISDNTNLELDNSNNSTLNDKNNAQNSNKKPPPQSLMIDSDEEIFIKRAIFSFKSGEEMILDSDKIIEAEVEEVVEDPEKENKNSFLHLSSIIYKNKNIWTIWLNNKKIKSSNNDPENEIYITDISNSHVSITWKMSLSKWKILSRVDSDQSAPEANEENQVVLNLKLKPNQTYAITDRSIREGRVILDR